MYIFFFFFFSSRRRHTRLTCDWSSDVCSSDLRGVEEIETVGFGERIETLGDDFDAGGGAFLDSAAAMMNLDLIVTPDNAIAHLAGALGRPTFVALMHVPEWRWLLDRDDSPWYPATRLFRQSSASDWAGVFARIADAVRARTAQAN